MGTVQSLLFYIFDRLLPLYTKYDNLFISRDRPWLSVTLLSSVWYLFLEFQALQQILKRIQVLQVYLRQVPFCVH